MKRSLVSLLILMICISCIAQDSLLRYVELPKNALEKIAQEQSQMEQKIQRQNEKVLKQLKKQEERIYSKLGLIDNIKTKELYAGVMDKYEGLENKLKTTPEKLENSKLGEYIPRMDSLETMLKFLAPLTEKKDQLGKATEQLEAVQTRLNQAGDIKKLIAERQDALKNLTANYQGLPKKYIDKYIGKYSKQGYYYKERIVGYKEDIKDQEKAEKLALEVLNKLPAFKKFMAENSELAQLFPMPANYGTTMALAGLQTRAGIQSQLQQLGVQGLSGSNSMDYVQQQIQQAQQTISTLKDKAISLGSAPGTEEMAMPDFKPNTEKKMTFLKRLEYGINIQNNPHTNILPDATDVGLFTGYKFSDRVVAGVGMSAKIGWGKLIKDIKVTGQGVGIRSYVDLKAKGNIWVSGGFEYNYFKDYNSLSQLVDIKAWQQSGLIGLSKKFTAGKKTGKIQFLWDFLSYSQVPRSQPFKFRINYNL